MPDIYESHHKSVGTGVALQLDLTKVMAREMSMFLALCSYFYTKQFTLSHISMCALNLTTGLEHWNSSIRWHGNIRWHGSIR